MITLVVAPDALQRSSVQIEDDAYRHLFRARRLEVGSEVRLVDGEGGARWSRVVEVGRRSAWLELAAEAPRNEPSSRLELIVPIPKRRRLIWMVEKATEVGVAAVRLIRTERAPRRCGGNTLEHLERVARAAVEQSHRAVVPEISGDHAWNEMPTLLRRAQWRWVLEPGAEHSSCPPAGDIEAVVVGPEGGWSPAELEELIDLGCRPLSLGPTLLRIETAAVIGCASLLIRGVFR